MKRVYIGTSGFYFEHWRGTFYPRDLSKNRFFQYYVERFDTVEINSTFYHLPRLKTVQHWFENSPERFRFALKAYRGITHYGRLENVRDELYAFLHLVKPLKSKIAAILFQLPPSLRRDEKLLENFLALLPRGYRFAMEFRHESWMTPEIFDLLRSADVALCLHDFGKRKVKSVLTADFLYMRFHGPDGRYGGCYDDETLDFWAQWLRETVKEVRFAYVYFNNDKEGHAVQNALRLHALLGVDTDGQTSLS